MPNCREIEPLVTAYVDGETTPADRALVTAHLEQCPPCRASAARQSAARAVVRDRARALVASTPPPVALRGRCMPPVRARSIRRALPWAAAASIAAAALLLVTLTTRSATVLAAQLTVDHVKCFEFVGNQPPDVRTLEAKLSNTFGWHVSIPPGSLAAGLTLLTARRCLYADGKVAHLMYRHHQRPVSLFVLSETPRAPEEVHVMGHEVVLWSDNQRSYVLIGREPRAELEELAAYVKNTIDDQPRKW
jgi:anti-sigma factor RsiW